MVYVPIVPVRIWPSFRREVDVFDEPVTDRPNFPREECVDIIIMADLREGW